MPKIKVGDKVRALLTVVGQFTEGKIYIVTDVQEEAKRDWLRMIDDAGDMNGWGSNNFELVVEEEKMPKLLKNGFHVGDIVYYMSDWANPDNLRTFGRVAEGRNGVDEENAVWAYWGGHCKEDHNYKDYIGWMETKEVQLHEPVAPINPVPAFPTPVPFIFISETNRVQDGRLAIKFTRAVESFLSVDAAQEHCLKLRAQHNDEKIFAYVRVE